MITPLIRIQDIADILIMTVLVYQLYSWFRASRAMQLLFGVGVLTLIYFITRFFGLHMTSWILQELGTVLFVLLIVVFQAEIRHALYRFSLVRYFFDSPKADQVHDRYHVISETLFELAARRTGALVVFQRSDSLADLALNGIRLDCEISAPILESIFSEAAPLHDGAVLIRDGRIALASCHLPLSSSSDLPRHYGTRHRAAIGLSERCDAVTVIVSEERGVVSVATDGEIRNCATPADLITHLEELLTPQTDTPRRTWKASLFSNLMPKTAVLLLVTVFWGLITTRQGEVSSVSAPVRLHGIPDNLVLLKNSPDMVELQVKSLSGFAPASGRVDLAVDLDLSGVREGQTTLPVRSSNITLPSGMSVRSVNPSSVKVQVEKKMRKQVQVRPALKGKLSGGQVSVSPQKVYIEGAAGQVSRIDEVFTEEIDAGRLVKGVRYRKNLVVPQHVVILQDEPVTLAVEPRRRNK